MASAFQANAFQNNAFQTDSIVPPAIPGKDPDAGAPRYPFGRSRPLLFIYEEYSEPERPPEQPKPVRKRRKVTRQLITETLATYRDLAGLLSADELMGIAPQQVEFIRPPNIDLSEQQQAIRAVEAAIRQYLLDHDEEDVIMLLMAAL